MHRAAPSRPIMSWVERPRPMTLHEYGMRKQRISAAAERLHLKGKTLEDEQRAQGNRISGHPPAQSGWCHSTPLLPPPKAIFKRNV